MSKRAATKSTHNGPKVIFKENDYIQRGPSNTVLSTPASVPELRICLRYVVGNPEDASQSFRINLKLDLTHSHPHGRRKIEVPGYKEHHVIDIRRTRLTFLLDDYHQF